MTGTRSIRQPKKRRQVLACLGEKTNVSGVSAWLHRVGTSCCLLCEGVLHQRKKGFYVRKLFLKRVCVLRPLQAISVMFSIRNHLPPQKMVPSFHTFPYPVGFPNKTIPNRTEDMRVSAGWGASSNGVTWARVKTRSGCLQMVAFILVPHRSTALLKRGVPFCSDFCDHIRMFGIFLWAPKGYGSRLNHQGTAGLVHVSIYQGSILGTYF